MAGGIEQFINSPFFVLVLLWALVWKGIALWKAALKRQVVWFAILLGFNSFGILEIVYIFWLSRWDIDKEKKVLRFLDEKVGQKIKTF
ncbi:MAG TPA: DUF5652 family protein [Clostridia bacterium]|nr:DUF5652 family protein [Clostridia bacterium]